MKLTSDEEVGKLVRTYRAVQIIGAVAMALLLTAAVVLGAYRHFSRPCDPDPWACFGAGRYEAMARGDVCPCHLKYNV